MSFQYFSIGEFACRHCGENKIDPSFVAKLDVLRGRVGFPLMVTSGYRCTVHNERIGGGPAHPSGRAADLGVDRERAYIVLREAMAMGEFSGIGIQQKGGRRFIHLDDLPSTAGAPRPTVWSYP